MIEEQAFTRDSHTVVSGNFWETNPFMVPILILAAIILGVIVWVVMDYFKHDGWRGEGTVVGREFIPAHIERFITYILVDKVMVPITNVIPYEDNWTLTLRDDKGKLHQVPVSHRDFRNVRTGARFTQS